METREFESGNQNAGMNSMDIESELTLNLGSEDSEATTSPSSESLFGPLYSGYQVNYRLRSAHTVGIHVSQNDPSVLALDLEEISAFVIKLGGKAFESIEKDQEHEQYAIIPFKNFGLVTETSNSSPSPDQQPEQNGNIYLELLASLETGSAIIRGIKLLQDEGFCSDSTYNIIVADANRPNVLKIRQVSMSVLHILLQLLQDAAFALHHKRNEILEDIAKISFHIVTRLGLGIPRTAIEAPGGKVFLAARNLQCQPGLVKDPIWAFNFIPQDSEVQNVARDGFYISSFIGDLEELWGPFKLHHAQDLETGTLLAIESRDGTILAVDSRNSLVAPGDDEVLCHWFGGADGDQDRDREIPNDALPIDTTKRLLIGTDDLYH
ncbi:hypothetical protein NHQ30_011639 [Ciborinia camelliae]|nr:hypothetical protein NHQ30_011639 [Ciborinia camelliae]